MGKHQEMGRGNDAEKRNLPSKNDFWQIIEENIKLIKALPIKWETLQNKLQ